MDFIPGNLEILGIWSSSDNLLELNIQYSMQLSSKQILYYEIQEWISLNIPLSRLLIFGKKSTQDNYIFFFNYIHSLLILPSWLTSDLEFPLFWNFCTLPYSFEPQDYFFEKLSNWEGVQKLVAL